MMNMTPAEWFITFSKMDDNSRCYEELPVTDELPGNIRSECLGREILILQPTECQNSNNESGVNTNTCMLLVLQNI